jgi:predicted porin
VRKYLALVLGVLLIFSLAATAFAEDKTDITIGGKILIRGWYLKDVTGISGNNEVPADTQSHAFWAENVNLTVDAKVSDNVRGFIELETARGEGQNSGLWYWGDHKYGYDSKPDAEILIRQAWIQYTGSGLFGIPSGIKIGHMPISLSEKQFLNNERFGDDALLVWVDPMKELHIAAGTVKLNEGDILSHSDDLDGYVLLLTYMWDKDNTVGANWVWAHSDGNCPSIDTSNNIEDLNFNNVGVHGNGKIAGLSYGAEVDFQFGKVKDILFSGEDLKAKGWAAFVKLAYAFDMVNVRGSFAYGSGDDDAFDEDCEEFQTLQGPDYAATARLVHYTQIYERTVRTAAHAAALTTTEGGNTTNTGIANTTYFNLGLDVTPLKELTLSLDGYYLQASETGAWEDDLDHSVDDNLGWEVDFKGTYKITKNLSYFVEAGWFMAGDFYKDITDVNSASSDKTVTQLVHGISLNF